MTRTHGTLDQNAAVWTLLIRTTSFTPSSTAIRITSTQIKEALTLRHLRRFVTKRVNRGATKCISFIRKFILYLLPFPCTWLFNNKTNKNASSPPSNNSPKQLTLFPVQCQFIYNYFLKNNRKLLLLCYLIHSFTKMPGQLIGRLLGLPAYRDKTTAFVLTAQQTIYRAIIVLLTVTAILWMAVFLYAAFYYSYMPAVSHTRPVHLQFESCGREMGLCTYPTANVTLTRRQQLLMVGQPYRVLVELDMPETKRNQDVGMFMVCLEMKDAEQVTIDKACRAAMLHYRSPLLQYIMTGAMAPFLMSGSVEEKQMVVVELFSGFEEDPMRPTTEAMVQVKSQHVDVYKVSLRIHAHFTGLRYFMFHWPVLSAFMGIMTNLFFLSVIAFLSWYKFFTPKQVVMHMGYDSTAAKTLEERRAMAKERLMRERSKLVYQKTTDGTPSTKGDGDANSNSASSPIPIPTKPKAEAKEKGVCKDDLEKPPSSEKSAEKEGKEDDIDNNSEADRRTPEDYEVISTTEESIKSAKLKCEVEDDADGDIEEEDFSELDPDTNGSKSSKEEDKENIPAEKQEAELRQRKTKKEGGSRSRTTTEEDGQS